MTDDPSPEERDAKLYGVMAMSKHSIDAVIASRISTAIIMSDPFTDRKNLIGDLVAFDGKRAVMQAGSQYHIIWLGSGLCMTVEAGDEPEILFS